MNVVKRRWVLINACVVIIFLVAIIITHECGVLLDNKSANVINVTNLYEDKDVFYVMEGTINNEHEIAYLSISKDNSNTLEVKLAIPSKYEQEDGAYLTLPIDTSEAIFTKDSGGLLHITGKNSDIEFELKQSSLPINKVYFVNAEFKKTDIVKRKNEDEEVIYFSKVNIPFIPDANEDLNLSISNTKNIDELDIDLEKKFLEYKNEHGFDNNIELIVKNSIGYIDSRILQIDIDHYEYTGGAHGMHTQYMRLYDLKQGREIDSSMSVTFNIDKDFMKLFDLYLEKQKDGLFVNALPVQVPPNAFFITPQGFIFTWNPYEIGPYSSGIISVFIDFKTLKPWIKDTSPVYYLFENI